MGCGSPFCSHSYPHVPDKHQWFSLSLYKFIRNVTFDKSLISQCNIRPEINVIITSSFLHWSRIIVHIFNGCVRKNLARQCRRKRGRCRLGTVTSSNFVIGVDERSFSSDFQGFHAWWAYPSMILRKARVELKCCPVLWDSLVDSTNAGPNVRQETWK